MATLSRKDRGAWLIQFFDQNKKRRPIHLGKKYNEKTARELKEIVEKIIYHRDNSLVPDKKTQTWIQEASPEIRDKLAAVGLIEKPRPIRSKNYGTRLLKRRPTPRIRR